MAVTVAEVKALSAALAALPDAAIQVWIDESPQHVATAGLDLDAADALVKLWVAHFATESNRAGGSAAGPVSAEAVGPVSVSYATGGAGAAGVSVTGSTVFGRLYLSRRRAIAQSETLVV